MSDQPRSEYLGCTGVRNVLVGETHLTPPPTES